MIKPIKIMLVGIVASFLIVLIIVCSVLLIFDINDFKPKLSAAIKTTLGRDVKFTGQLKLTIFSELNLSTGAVVVANTKDFQNYFMSVDNINLRLKLLPLLSRRMDVGMVTIQGLKLNLMTNQRGINNWLGRAPTASVGAVPSQNINMTALLMAFTSQGIRIENANINWENQQSGQQIEVSNIGFKTSVVALNTPIISDFNMIVRDKKKQLALSLNGQTTLTTNSGFSIFRLENNALHGTIAGTVIPGKSLAFTLSSKDVLFDKAEQLLKASDVQLKLAGMQITSDIMSRFTNKPATVTGHMRVITFNPSQFMQQLAIPLPTRRDTKTLQQMAAEFNFQATDTAVAVNNLTMTLDNSRLTGSVAIKNSAKPTTLLRLHIDNLAVDGYLPAQHTPEKSIDPAAILAGMPVEALRKLRISGRVVVDKLLVHGAHLQQVSLNLAR